MIWQSALGNNLFKSYLLCLRFASFISLFLGDQYNSHFTQFSCAKHASIFIYFHGKIPGNCNLNLLITPKMSFDLSISLFTIAGSSSIIVNIGKVNFMKNISRGVCKNLSRTAERSLKTYVVWVSFNIYPKQTCQCIKFK